MTVPFGPNCSRILDISDPPTNPIATLFRKFFKSCNISGPAFYVPSAFMVLLSSSTVTWRAGVSVPSTSKSSSFLTGRFANASEGIVYHKSYYRDTRNVLLVRPGADGEARGRMQSMDFDHRV